MRSKEYTRTSSGDKRRPFVQIEGEFVMNILQVNNL